MSAFRYRPFRTQPRRLSRMLLGRGFVTNVPPVITVPGAQSAVSNVALAITGTSLADADGNPQTVTLTVSHGTFSLAGTTGLSFSVGDGTADATMTFSGSVANINTAIATLTYTSTTDYEGADSLAISTDDGAGGTDSDSVAITVTFTPASLSSRYQEIDLSVRAKFFSDAGTSEAVADDPVYRAVSTEDAAFYIEQATLAKRPILKQAANGKYYLQGTVAGLTWLVGTYAASLPQPSTVVVGFRFTDTPTGNFVDSPNVNRNLIYVSGGNAAYFAGSVSASATAYVASTKYVQQSVFNGASSKIILDATTIHTGNPGTGASDGLTLFSDQGGGNTAPIDVWYVGVFSDDVSAYAAQLRTYVQSLEPT